ncbi:glycosyltransferase family A protein [Iningainema tapete]|uniref:Glycosyltransferase family 2 protein n=1 Tax=Iningainema tapete BLCC-T55 TaxID=2748662 RepID=A0A8J6XKQ9_9CYAN|nr:glycosyltransferase family 2 protein [Iningainema tapete]MBD2774446.1 glycosyltransferase family 2 protein [Iningainema tapete BLCC-T55]
MDKLLTIAIPTFNRAKFLEQQLTWLSKAINGFESDCEILISDNCSTDNTQEIIKKWQNIFINTIFKSHINNENIGLMPNLAYCLQAATSKYVWVIGDDDPIQENALADIIYSLKEHSDLSLLILNYSILYVPNNQIVRDRCFDVAQDEIYQNGKAVIEKYLKQEPTLLAFMTAQVYRTSSAQQALSNWKDSLNNREAQIYWTAFCALQGRVKITKDVYVEYACGMNSVPGPELWFKMRYADLPTVYEKLTAIGYCQIICRKFILQHFAVTNWKVVLGALRQWPFFTIKIIIPYLYLVSVSLGKLFLHLIFKSLTFRFVSSQAH